MKTIEINGVKYQADSDFPNDIVAEQNRRGELRRQAIKAARAAMARLAEALRGRSGQPYYLRSLLYSLWNGKPASVLDAVHLDLEIRQDLAALLVAWGYSDRTEGEFFYDELKQAVVAAGQWDWFLEEYHNVTKLKEFLDAYNM